MSSLIVFILSFCRFAINSICIHSSTTIIHLSLFIALSPCDVHCLRHSCSIQFGSLFTLQPFAILYSIHSSIVATDYSHTFFVYTSPQETERRTDFDISPFYVRTVFTLTKTTRKETSLFLYVRSCECFIM